MFTPTQIGWIYSPSAAYNLDRVETTFRSVPNPGTLARDVTMSIWDELPGSGGTILKTGMFNVDRSGGVQGISFSEFALTAGEDYFISLENIGQLGLNMDANAFTATPPAGIDYLDGWYTGTNFATHIPLGNPPGAFSAPILRFFGSPINVTLPPNYVPEPASLMIMAGLGLCSIGSRARRSRRRKTVNS